VFDGLSKTLSGVAVSGLLALSLATAAFAQAPAAKAPAVKDQGEYDLTVALQKETDPQKQLDLLHQWEQKYPDSDYKGQRAMRIASAEGQIAAKGVQANASAAALDAAVKAAQDLEDNLNKYLAPENKPENVTDEQWKQARQTMEMQAHTILATIAMNKKNPEGDAAAEKEFKKEMELSPGDASATYQLGVLILRERNLARYSEGLFYIAKAIQITGPQALAPAGKTAAQTYLKKAYEGYHGDDKGLDELMKASASNPTPPADFRIESVTEIAKKAEGDEAAFNKAHPDIALWRQIKGALTAADGDMYFMTIKDAGIPPAGNPEFAMFQAKVVSQPSPKELLLNVENPAGDVTLEFENALKGTIEPGTAIKFKGVVKSFVKEPYMLTLTADKEDVDGLPATAFAGAPATRPRGPARGGVKKK
jgi:hypothetical protein